MKGTGKLLLVLSFASVAVAPPASTNARAAGPFDHLRCYRVQRDLRDVPQVGGLMLTPDQIAAFSAQTGCRLRSARAYEVCVPVAKSPSNPPAGADLSSDYVCYRLKCEPPASNQPTQLQVSDQFGTGTLIVRQQAGDSQTLCVPSPYLCRTASSSATLPFFDSFNQSDGTALSATWVKALGELIISSNALVSDFAGDSVALQNGISNANVAVQADVNLANAPSDASAGLLLHVTGAAQFCSAACPSFYLGRIRKAASTFHAEIVKTMDCTSSTLASQTVGSQTGNLKFVASGSDLTLSLNGASIAVANDSSIGPGTIGVFANGSGVSFDNFSGNVAP